ncbi:MAG: glycine zipper 2TM domain-containing protein [Phycisphaerae bacterium]|nr:glycine zipper 2TM domain-containing protein [Phycisphaerae bacterium]
MRAGQILNVPAVLLVTIPKYGEKMSMTIKMLDVEQGNILWIGTGSASTGKSLGTFLGAAAGAALGAAVAGGDSGDRTLGAIAGGVGGGVAGHLLSPEEEEVVQKCIKDVCKDLPSHLVPAGSIRRP